MKYVIVILVLLSVVSCRKVGSINRTSDAVGEMRYVPQGATLIKEYYIDGSKTRWMKWYFEGDCFLSYDLMNNRGLLTKVTCPQ